MKSSLDYNVNHQITSMLIPALELSTALRIISPNHTTTLQSSSLMANNRRK